MKEILLKGLTGKKWCLLYVIQRPVIRGLHDALRQDTLITRVTVKPLDDTCESFNISLFIRDTLKFDSDIIDIPQLQETNKYLLVQLPKC